MLYNMIKDTRSYPTTQEELARLLESKKDIYIFGGILGGMSLGSQVVNYLESKGIEIKGYIANKRFIKQQTYKGKPIYALEDNNLPRDIAVVVGMSIVKDKTKELKKYGFSSLYFLNVVRDVYVTGDEFLSYFLENESEFDKTYNLLQDGVSKEVMIGLLQDRIYNNYSTLHRTEDTEVYFNDLFRKHATSNEVLIDCGAYDGDTALAFIDTCKDYEKIYCLEPSKDLFVKLQKNMDSHRAVLFQKGAWDKQDTLYFEDKNETGGSRIVDSESAIKIEVDSIDNMILNGGGGAIA